MKHRYLAIGILIVFAVLYFFAQVKHSQRKAQEGVYTQGKHALGLSIAKEYLSDQLQLNKKAFHDYLDLRGYDMVAIHSPKFPLSLYEIETLKTYVYEGGNLLLTALTEDDYVRLNLYPLLSSKKADNVSDKRIKAAKDKAFKNGQTITVEWPEMQKIKYYSAMHWVEVIDKKESKNKAKKKQKYNDPEEVHLVHDPEHILQWTLGKGIVTVMLGVPPYANTMLQFKENQEFLRLLKGRYPKIMWDVYHHYVKQAGMADLLQDKQVIVPILGFVLFVLFYFFVSPQKAANFSAESDEQVPSYHQFYEGLFSPLLKNNKGREDAYAFFHKKITQLYGLKQDKLVQTGQMDEKEFIQKWNTSIHALSKHFKINKD